MFIRLTLLPLATGMLSGCGPTPKGKPYPLDTCLISGNKLGAHGRPFVFVLGGQEVTLCCEPCLEDFTQDPAKYLAEITAKSKP